MSHHAEVFHTDPLFCPYCGTILPLGNVDFVECRLCLNQQKFLVGQSEEYSCRLFAIRKDTMSSVKKGEGPLVDRKCLRCGNEQMTYSTQQTRSADEGQTVFYCCPQCQGTPYSLLLYCLFDHHNWFIDFTVLCITTYNHRFQETENS